MSQKVNLTRDQIERMAMYVKLNKNVNSVTILQHSASGIGLEHRVIYHQDQARHDIVDDLTDVSNW